MISEKKIYPSENYRKENLNMVNAIAKKWEMNNARALNLILKYVMKQLDKKNILLHILFDKDKKDG